MVQRKEKETRGGRRGKNKEYQYRKETLRYINKYRKMRKGIDEGIELETWRKHFMGLLGGKERRIVWQPEEEGAVKGKAEEGKEEETRDLAQEELIKQWERLKLEKAPGEDRIENEAWKYISEEIGEVFKRLINGVWKNGKISGNWNNGLISLIFKKREKSEVGNYRGVTLMNAYKIYASILNDKLMRAVENK